MSAGVLLTIAIVAEVAATVALKASDGLSRPGPTVIVVVGYVFAFWLMAKIVQEIPVSVTYAIWSATGTAAVAALGVMLYGEPMGLIKATGLALIISGVVTLQFAQGSA
ncbi:MAG: emrE [Solirubrobacterales bacterium]|jgi:small multidrug resistance pump|nr:emrE [Solirubrobacterales bacterium]